MTLREAYEKYWNLDTILSNLINSESVTVLVLRDLWHTIKTEVEKHDKTRSLLDGCYNLVEIWKPESPAQVEWKHRWLKEAKEVINAEG